MKTKICLFFIYLFLTAPNHSQAGGGVGNGALRIVQEAAYQLTLNRPMDAILNPYLLVQADQGFVKRYREGQLRQQDLNVLLPGSQVKFVGLVFIASKSRVVKRISRDQMVSCELRVKSDRDPRHVPQEQLFTIESVETGTNSAKWTFADNDVLKSLECHFAQGPVCRVHNVRDMEKGLRASLEIHTLPAVIDVLQQRSR